MKDWEWGALVRCPAAMNVAQVRKALGLQEPGVRDVALSSAAGFLSAKATREGEDVRVEGELRAGEGVGAGTVAGLVEGHVLSAVSAALGPETPVPHLVFLGVEEA